VSEPQVSSQLPRKCPACGTSIQLQTQDTLPRLGVIYRCNVCHLELVVNPKTGTLTVAPLTPIEPA
jgi:hypothetical protein